MKKIIFSLLISMFTIAAANAQFRMVGNGTWVTLNDSTYRATISFYSDLTGQGYLASQILQDSFMLFTGLEQLYRIDSAYNKTFSGATLIVVRMDGFEGAPTGQIMVYNPDGRSTIPQAPFASNGATAQLQAAVVTYNAKVAGDPTMGGDLSGTATTAQIVANAVGSSEIATGAVTTSEILDATVAWADLAQHVKDSINAAGGGSVGGFRFSTKTVSSGTATLDSVVTFLTGTTSAVIFPDGQDGDVRWVVNERNANVSFTVHASDGYQFDDNKFIPANLAVQYVFNSTDNEWKVGNYEPMISTISFTGGYDPVVPFSLKNRDAGDIDVVAGEQMNIDTGAVAWLNLSQAVKDSINAGGGDNVSSFPSAFRANATNRYAMTNDSSLTHQKLTNQLRDSVGITQFDWLKYAEQRSNNIGDSLLYQLKNTDTLHVMYRISDTKAVKYEMQKRDAYRKLNQVSIVEPEKYTNWTSSTGTWSGTSLKSGGLGNTVTLTFTGTGVLLNYYSDNSRGKIKFVLDGNASDTIVVDGYNASTVSYARATLWQNLEYGTHTIVGTVVTKNPASSGNNFSIWNYVGGSVVLRDNYNFVVKTFNSPTYTYEIEKITATGSNMEFALNVSPLGSGLSAAFIPYHGVDACLSTGDSLKIYVDGKWGVAVPGVASPYRSAKRVVLTQEVYGWHPDSLGVSGKQVLQLNTTHSFEKSRCDVTGNFKWLRRTIVSGYSFMLPISASWGDTLITSQGQKIGLDLTDNSNQTVTNKQGLATSFLATKNGGKYALAARINDDATLRKNRPYRATVPQFLEHRNDGLTQKLYNNIYNSDTTDVGELLNTSFSLFVINKDTSSWTPPVATGGGGSGSTTLVAGTGINVVESPTDTWTVTNTGDTDGTDDVTSSGLTTNTIPKASASKVLSNSQITDDGATVSIGGTSGLVVPIGTTAQQTANNGKVRFNSSNNALEYYNGAASAWEVPVKGATGTGLFTATLIPFADANGRLGSNGSFYYLSGTGGGMIVNNMQFNGNGTSTSTTGQGFAVEGSSRMMRYLAAGGNAAAGDQAAFYHRVGSITRTASTAWQGWNWDITGLTSGSTVRDLTMHNFTTAFGVNMDTVTWLRYPTPTGGFSITKNKGIIQQQATLNGIGTLYPTRQLDVRGGIRMAEFYNGGDSTGITGQIPVKRGTGWGWASTSSALDANYWKLSGRVSSANSDIHVVAADSATISSANTILSASTNIYLNPTGELVLGNGSGTNLPTTNSDQLGMDLGYDGTGVLVGSQKTAKRNLIGLTDPVSGSTIAFYNGQLYTNSATGDIFVATTASANPDLSGTGSTWVKVSDGGSVTISDTLNDFPAATSITASEKLVMPDSTVTWQKVVNQIRDSTLFGDGISEGTLGRGMLGGTYMLNHVSKFSGTRKINLNTYDLIFGRDTDSTLFRFFNTSGSSKGFYIQPSSGGKDYKYLLGNSVTNWAFNTNSAVAGGALQIGQSGAAPLLMITTGPALGVGTGITSFGLPQRFFHVESPTSKTNSIDYHRYGHITDASATTGFGFGTEIELENASASKKIVATTKYVYTDATAGSEDVDYIVGNIVGGTLADRLYLRGSKLGIGVSSPTSSVDVQTGSATQAPLKFTVTGAALLTTPVMGNVEVLGNKLFYTDSTGVRCEIQKIKKNVTGVGTLTLTTDYSDYIFTGTTSTWTLPSISNGDGVLWRIKNRGSGNITINSASGGNDIYDASAVSTYTVTAGSAIIILNDGTYFNIQ
jgi:hypothetical protein